jgi:hypothetical protein
MGTRTHDLNLISILGEGFGEATGKPPDVPEVYGSLR